jgi:hypothetical protein
MRKGAILVGITLCGLSAAALYYIRKSIHNSSDDIADGLGFETAYLSREPNGTRLRRSIDELNSRGFIPQDRASAAGILSPLGPGGSLCTFGTPGCRCGSEDDFNRERN